MNVRRRCSMRARDKTRLTGPLRVFSLDTAAAGKAACAQSVPNWHRYGVPRLEVEGNGAQVLGGEEVRTQVRVTLGHYDGIVPKNLFELLNGAIGKYPLRREGV